ncbi:MAG: isoprenylcysteine carboxylmethyltransferase family protein [Ignavibacteriales bacterium]|nr:isoprenylcysteine carboxylmethyltransferase family protein [Ignavibacteriales bacterium]
MPSIGLVFNVFAVIGLYLIWDLAPHPSLQIYKLPPPYDYLVLIPQFISLAGIIWCFKYICFKEFIGLNQIDRYLRNEYSDNDLDENYTLRIEGPYKYSRHPIYFFSIIILMFRAEMSLFYLTMFISFTAYFYIGSYYEEKKMVRLFGDDYRDYQKKVPRIFPFKILVSFRRRTESLEL